MQHILSLLIWLPIMGGVIVLVVGDNKPKTARAQALLTTLMTLALCVPLFLGFDVSSAAMQYTERLSWVPQFNMSYALGIDGISLILIILTIFTNLIVVLATWQSINQRVAQYMAAFLMMQGILVGVFSAMDAMLFYIFFEASLIPMYLIIGIWGSSNRVYAAIKFFLYTFAGSVLMLIALIYLGLKADDFAIASFYQLDIDPSTQNFIFWAFFFAFAIKVPMWPVHTWLPDAHTEAPAGGSVMLAAILLKLGAYGFLRFSLPIVPAACEAMAPIMITLSLIAVVYIGFVAIVQKDMKKLIAYSSISHMGFVTLGFFSIYKIMASSGSIADAGLIFEGALFIMISHAFVSGALFAGVGFIYDRMHTRNISDFGGVVNTMPTFSAFMMLFAMANAGLPGTSGFVGEFMVILGAIRADFVWGVLAASTLILGAAYTLLMYKRVIFGDIANVGVRKLKDIQGFELSAFVLLAIAVLFFGIYPKPILDILHPAVDNLLQLTLGKTS